MRSKRDIRLAVSICIAIAMALFLPQLSIAGELEPSAPPGSTMHTLDEIYNIVRTGSAVTCTPGVARSGQRIVFGAGDDGDLQKGMGWPNPRFTKNGDGTVTDNLTNLMWTENANLYGGQYWADALNSCSACLEGGHNDWRLPQIRELLSLIHYGYYDMAVPNTAGTFHFTTDGDPFTNLYQPTSTYWTSTTYAKNNITGEKLGVAMTTGLLYLGLPFASKFNVWCVRDAQ